MNELKAEANRLGFSLIGVAPIITPPRFTVYQNWIGAGNHAGMSYLASERHFTYRKNPSFLLSSARSIIVLAYPYPNPVLTDFHIRSNPGNIASYAWLPDYHDVIPEKLDKLMSLVQLSSREKINYITATDSKPVLERNFAELAGLGWIGKNGCLINPATGSYFLLAEIISDLSIESASQIINGSERIVQDHCGSCRRCIEACPTGCIRQDRTLDAGKCISYLTIENKGSIARSLRPQIGQWIFGCDICQMVCPWNTRFAPKSWDHIDKLMMTVDLATELQIDEQTFKAKYRHSPISRAKHQGWLRNLCVAAGNQHDPAYLDQLENLIRNSSSSVVRSHAIWAYHQIKGNDAIPDLKEWLSRETDPLILDELRALPL